MERLQTRNVEGQKWVYEYLQFTSPVAIVVETAERWAGSGAARGQNCEKLRPPGKAIKAFGPLVHHSSYGTHGQSTVTVCSLWGVFFFLSSK